MRQSDRSIPPQAVARFRLSRHHLAGSYGADLPTIARDICGAQAQIMSAAYLQFWARNHQVRRADVETQLWQKRSLVKTSLMRQTVHLIPAEEFPIYIAALRSSRIAAVLRVMGRFGIDREEADGLTALIMESLSSGPLGRTAIADFVRPKVSRRIRSWMSKVWSIVRIPVSEGLICYGPGEGNEVCFIRSDQWLKKHKAVDSQKARVELFRRYLRAYGPATLRDFCHWSGMTAGEVRPLEKILKGELCEVLVEKHPCLLLREDLKTLEKAASAESCVHLLPHFDPYLLGHREKDHLVPSRHYKSVYRNQGWISPAVLVNGSITGTWSYRVKSRRVHVRVELFAQISREIRAAVAQDAQRFSEFFHAPLEQITFA